MRAPSRNELELQLSAELTGVRAPGVRGGRMSTRCGSPSRNGGFGVWSRNVRPIPLRTVQVREDVTLPIAGCPSRETSEPTRSVTRPGTLGPRQDSRETRTRSRPGPPVDVAYCVKAASLTIQPSA